MIRVVLVDDHPVVLDGIKTIITAEPDIEVVGETTTPDNLAALVAARQPNVLVMDLVFQYKASGIDAIGIIHRQIPSVAILTLSMHTEIQYARQALAAGATGYLTKGEASGLIVNAIRAVAKGAWYLSPMIASQLAAPHDPSSLQVPPSIRHLTKREQAVFEALSQGLTVKEVGRRLGMAASTVGTHIENMKKKFHLSSSTELIRFAMEEMLREGFSIQEDVTGPNT